MIENFAAPLSMMHQKRQEARIQALGMKATRFHIRKQKRLLKALRASESDAIKALIDDAEWTLQEQEQKLAELTNAHEDSLLWCEWLDLALRLTKGGDDGSSSELTG